MSCSGDKKESSTVLGVFSKFSDKHSHHFIGEYPIGICTAQCSCSFSLVLVTKDEPQYKINRTRKLKLHCRKQCKQGKKKEIDNSL